MWSCKLTPAGSHCGQQWAKSSKGKLLWGAMGQEQQRLLDGGVPDQNDNQNQAFYNGFLFCNYS